MMVKRWIYNLAITFFGFPVGLLSSGYCLDG